METQVGTGDLSEIGVHRALKSSDRPACRMDTGAPDIHGTSQWQSPRPPHGCYAYFWALCESFAWTNVSLEHATFSVKVMNELAWQGSQDSPKLYELTCALCDTLKLNSYLYHLVQIFGVEQRSKALQEQSGK